MRNRNIAIHSKTNQAKMMRSSQVIEHKFYLQNTKFQHQKHLVWHFTNQNVSLTDQVLSPELKQPCTPNFALQNTL